jgi:hypothetical protein
VTCCPLGHFRRPAVLDVKIFHETQSLGLFLGTRASRQSAQVCFDPTVAQFQHLGPKFTFEHFGRNKTPSAA